MTSTNSPTLSSKQGEELLKALKARFEKNMDRHQGLDWANVQTRLEANPEKLWSLHEMERTIWPRFSIPSISIESHPL